MITITEAHGFYVQVRRNDIACPFQYCDARSFGIQNGSGSEQQFVLGKSFAQVGDKLVGAGNGKSDFDRGQAAFEAGFGNLERTFAAVGSNYGNNAGVTNAVKYIFFQHDFPPKSTIHITITDSV